MAAKLSTPLDAYCLVGKSVDLVPGRMMQGDETTLNYIDDRDITFQAAWNPDSDITAVETSNWGAVKALYR